MLHSKEFVYAPCFKMLVQTQGMVSKELFPFKTNVSSTLWLYCIFYTFDNLLLLGGKIHLG